MQLGHALSQTMSINAKSHYDECAAGFVRLPILYLPNMVRRDPEDPNCP